MIRTTPRGQKLTPGRGITPSGGGHDGCCARLYYTVITETIVPRVIYYVTGQPPYIPPTLDLFSELGQSSAMWLKLM